MLNMAFHAANVKTEKANHSGGLTRPPRLKQGDHERNEDDWKSDQELSMKYRCSAANPSLRKIVLVKRESGTPD